MEGDSEVVISWAQSAAEGSWVLRNSINEIRAILREMATVLSHIPRCQNGEADRLTKWGREQVECYRRESYLEWD